MTSATSQIELRPAEHAGVELGLERPGMLARKDKGGGRCECTRAIYKRAILSTQQLEVVQLVVETLDLPADLRSIHPRDKVLHGSRDVVCRVCSTYRQGTEHLSRVGSRGLAGSYPVHAPDYWPRLWPSPVIVSGPTRTWPCSTKVHASFIVSAILSRTITTAKRRLQRGEGCERQASSSIE